MRLYCNECGTIFLANRKPEGNRLPIHAKPVESEESLETLPVCLGSHGEGRLVRTFLLQSKGIVIGTVLNSTIEQAAGQTGFTLKDFREVRRRQEGALVANDGSEYELVEMRDIFSPLDVFGE